MRRWNPWILSWYLRGYGCDSGVSWSYHCKEDGRQWVRYVGLDIHVVYWFFNINNTGKWIGQLQVVHHHIKKWLSPTEMCWDGNSNVHIHKQGNVAVHVTSFSTLPGCTLCCWILSHEMSYATYCLLWKISKDPIIQVHTVKQTSPPSTVGNARLQWKLERNSHTVICRFDTQDSVYNWYWELHCILW